MTFNFKRKILTLVLLMLYLTGAMILCQDQTQRAAAVGSNTTLTCVISVDQLVRWFDLTNNIIMYILNQDGESVRDIGASDDKYNRYFAELITPTQFSLSITSVEVSDNGSFVCEDLFNGENIIQYGLAVEAEVTSLTIDCTSPCDNIDGIGRIEVETMTQCQCACTGIGGFPDSLTLEWSKGVAGTQTSEVTSAGPSGTYDFTRTVIFTTAPNFSPLECQVTGYNVQSIKESSDIIEQVSFNILYTPICTLELSIGEVGDNGCSVTMGCRCDANPEVKSGGYSYFNFNDLIDGNDDTTTTNIVLDTTSEFSCRGSNVLGTGDISTAVPYSCSCLPVTKSTTPCTISKEECPKCSSPALIAICSVEGVAIIAMMLVIGFLYSGKKGWRKAEAPTPAIQLYDPKNRSNSAYMDLQDTKKASPVYGNVNLPYENLDLRELLPGKGHIDYRRGQTISTSKREEIVVKTVSDNSPTRLAKLQADEVRMLSTLKSNKNVVQFIGYCNKVPNLLVFEFISGNNLVKYLEENFQRSKIHQYGNTKQKRFHVAEKGSVESLPKFALQIACGMKFLTAQKLLHPGLRSEKIIIDVSGQCKLYDFVSKDNANEIIAILWSKSVPYQWMPPEYLFLEKLGPTVDVWSFGVVLWEIFSYGAEPYEGKSRSDVEKRLREKEFLEIPNNCPGAIWQIVLNCWEQSPEKRPPFGHLYVQLSHMCNENKEYDEIHSK